jgi:hypothetical protein
MGQRGTVFAKTFEAQDYFDQTEFRLSSNGRPKLKYHMGHVCSEAARSERSLRPKDPSLPRIAIARGLRAIVCADLTRVEIFADAVES